MVLGLVVPVALSLAVMLAAPSAAEGWDAMLITDARLAQTLVMELALIAVLGTLLWRAGWRPHRTATLPLSWRDLPRGAGLWVVALLVYAAWAAAWWAVEPGTVRAAVANAPTGRPTIAVAVALSLVNAVFEEAVWLGLGVAALRRAGVRTWTAAAVSLGCRLLVHVYQGPLVLVAILPIGAVFTFYYVRTSRIWPVIVAHALQDIVALSALASGLGARPGAG